MKARVQKWGNSLALRIPKALAAEAHLAEGSRIELSLVDGKLVIQALRPESPTLADLLAQVTDANRHGAWNTGPAAGKEAW